MSQALTAFPVTVDEQRRRNSRTLTMVYVGVLALAALLGMYVLGRAGEPFPLALTMLVLASLVVLARPVAGVYLVVFLTLVTDAPVTPSFPFLGLFSSDGSMLFIDQKLALSPLEVILGVMTVSWMLRLLFDRRDVAFVKGRLLVPVIAFTGFLLFGLAVGLATGGDRYVAIWELRPILYLPVFYLLVTNLLTTRQQYHRAGVLAVVALVVHSLLALELLFGMTPQQREDLNSLVAHGSAVQLSLVLLMVFAVWVLPRGPWAARWLLPLAAIPMAWAWLASGRRAAAVGLVIGVIMLGIVLSQLNPKLLRKVGPVVVVVGLAYVGAFWNSESQLGFPAQAVKSVISEKDASERDQDSNLYRTIENFNIMATIHSKPVTGVGFGQKFLRPVPLPDISFFVFYEYIPHNSVLWIWMKAGIGGFVAMLFLFASAVRYGVQAVLRLPPGRDVVLAFAATAYLVMYLVFAYVDIAWDARSMICVAFAMAVCSELTRLPSRAGPGDAHPVADPPAPVPAVR